MTAGSGHIMAAKSILDYALSYVPDMHVEHFDFSKITDPITRFMDRHSYEILIKTVPSVWGWFYNTTNKSRLAFFVSEVVASLQLFSQHDIVNLLKEKSPDVIIFTNPVPARLFIKKINKLFGNNTKTAVVVTDYHVHRLYKMPTLDYYFVGHGEVKYELMEMGVPKEKIIVTGIPVNPRCYILQDVPELKSKYKIKNNLPVVLFLTSSLKKSIVFRTINVLSDLKDKINVVVITGGNKGLHDKIKKDYDNFLVVNWTDVMDEYMKISDVVIGKPGGLISSECMAIKKPLIIPGMIPGVEYFNAKYMEKNRFGITAFNKKDLISALDKIIVSKSFHLSLNEIYKENPSKIIVEQVKTF